MTYLATYTGSNAAPVVMGEYWTLSDACAACYAHHSNEWDAAIGTERFSNPVYQYHRGAFSQWNGIPRLYLTTPDGDMAHYDITKLAR